MTTTAEGRAVPNPCARPSPDSTVASKARRATWPHTTMLKLAPLTVATMLMATGCSVATEDAQPVDHSEGELLKQTGITSSWSYRGMMPALDSPQLTVSLKGHTLHAAGLLPDGFQGDLPFHAKTEAVGARTRVHVVYPIATVDLHARLPGGGTTRNPEPFDYQVCGGDNFHASNSIGAFGGFPFIEYVCDHTDHDGRVRSGIAFHGPITTTQASGASYWSLKRGPVSHACNRMLGEHVLELAHIIGFDRGKRGTPVKVIAAFDTFQGKVVDVDYAPTGWTRAAASDSVVFPIWQAVRLRDDGTTAVDFPQWACETSRCASMPANTRDPLTGAPL